MREFTVREGLNVSFSPGCPGAGPSCELWVTVQCSENQAGR